MKLYFIAGASGSGKTAVIQDLKKCLGSNYLVYDFDDIGVPDNADKKWRQEATEKWLQKLLSEDKHCCLLGQMVLGEILACPSASQLGEINFCLLDVSDMERVKRLKQRNTYGVDQNMLNWASWLRMHHQDPQWMQQVLKDGCWENSNFSVWDKLDNWISVANINILDTTGLSITEVASSVSEWIHQDVYTNNKAQQAIKVQKITPLDIPFMVELSNKKRNDYSIAQPKFWRKAVDANTKQSSWFQEILHKDDYILLIAQDAGFIIGQLIKAPEVYDPGGLTLVIDDFCVQTPNLWFTVGSALINEIKVIAKNKGAAQILIVCGSHDEDKRQFLKNRQFLCASEWYIGEIK